MTAAALAADGGQRRPRREHRDSAASAAVVRAELHAHEDQCTERYERILERIARLEVIVLVCAGTLIVGMAGIIMTVLMRGH